MSHETCASATVPVVPSASWTMAGSSIMYGIANTVMKAVLTMSAPTVRSSRAYCTPAVRRAHALSAGHRPGGRRLRAPAAGSGGSPRARR